MKVETDLHPDHPLVKVENAIGNLESAIQKVIEEQKTNNKKGNCNHLNQDLSNFFHVFIK